MAAGMAVLPVASSLTSGLLGTDLREATIQAEFMQTITLGHLNSALGNLSRAFPEFDDYLGYYGMLREMRRELAPVDFFDLDNRRRWREASLDSIRETLEGFISLAFVGSLLCCYDDLLSNELMSFANLLSFVLFLFIVSRHMAERFPGVFSKAHASLSSLSDMGWGIFERTARLKLPLPEKEIVDLMRGASLSVPLSRDKILSNICALVIWDLSRDHTLNSLGRILRNPGAALRALPSLIFELNGELAQPAAGR